MSEHPVTGRKDGYRRDWTPQGHEDTDAPHDHERLSVARPKIVLSVAGGLLAFGLLVHFALAGVLALFKSRPADWTLQPRRFWSPLANSIAPVPPPPRLQAAPEDDLNALRSQETATLNTCGWIDRPRGIVRIPIDRAKELLLQRGLPHAPGASTAARPDALPSAPFPNNGVLLGGETPEEGGPGHAS